jgi:predicted nucleic acid-binding protein
MMYLLDTNVVSELRKAKTRRVNRRVYQWAKDASRAAMFLSAISVLELELGILLVERRDRSQGAVLRSWMENHVLPAFEGRVLAVDVAVARKAAALHVPDPRPHREALIAATALVHGMTVVTRNVADFEPTGVTLVNPWEI